MVGKERDDAEHRSRSPRVVAGAAVERQVAHYLRRAFADHPAVVLLHDLRLPVPGRAGDFVQVDHLIVHRYGLIVIESKSATSGIGVTPDGQWVRKTRRGTKRGMPSPILQAGRQADAIRQCLAAARVVLDVARPMQVATSVLVAIGDDGIVEWGGADLPEVCKADAVPGRVREVVERSRGGVRWFDAAGRRAVAEFLVSRHTPRRPSRTAHVRPIVVPTRPACRTCGSGALHAQYGRYGYYFRCLNCTANTPIDRGCPACGSATARVRKDRLNFFKDCGSCGRTTLFYVNASLCDLEEPGERS